MNANSIPRLILIDVKDTALTFSLNPSGGTVISATAPLRHFREMLILLVQIENFLLIYRNNNNKMIAGLNTTKH